MDSHITMQGDRLLFIHSLCNGVYLSATNEQSIPLPPTSPLAPQACSLCLCDSVLFSRQGSFQCHTLDSVYKGCHMALVFFPLTLTHFIQYMLISVVVVQS